MYVQLDVPGVKGYREPSALEFTEYVEPSSNDAFT
jgi:hypothetical protein